MWHNEDFIKKNTRKYHTNSNEQCLISNNSNMSELKFIVPWAMYEKNKNIFIKYPTHMIDQIHIDAVRENLIIKR